MYLIGFFFNYFTLSIMYGIEYVQMYYWLVTRKLSWNESVKWATFFHVFQEHFFDEYAMEGVSAEDNEIYLEFVPENLVKALKTAQMAKWVKIKLTKKHAPCITVEVDLVSSDWSLNE